MAIVDTKKEPTFKIRKIQRNWCFHVKTSMVLHAFIPVSDALRCHFSQPWGFSCNDPRGRLRCQTSLRHLRRIYRPAVHKKAVQLQRWAITLWAASSTQFPHLVSDHHMCDLRPAVQILVLLLIGEHGEDKVPWFTLAFSHQKAPSFAFVCQKFLCVSPRQMPVVPPGEETLLG